MELNDHLRQMLKDLGQAINESISGSGRVHDSIQRIRDEKGGVKREGRGKRNAFRPAEPANEERAAFRMNLKDLHFLKSVGIDPTARVRRRRAVARRAVARRASPRAARGQ